MENFFSRLTLDIIGKAVFNYDFDSLTHDDPVIQARSLCLGVSVLVTMLCPCLLYCVPGKIPSVVLCMDWKFLSSSIF